MSIEPDDGTTDARFSPFGLLTDEARTLCGEIDRASNDGQTYTGDVDYAQFQTIDDGRVRLTLDWKGKTDLDLLVYDGNATEWIQSDSDEIELSLDSGFHAVLVAGVDGPPADYVLTARIE